tara:strand:- start:110 stop:526 length:417 start_codon:yes stop_codon:yes gene_type:complete
MTRFSPEIKNFFEQVGMDEEAQATADLSMVPKSDSCAVPGDFLIFKYKLGTGKGSRSFRLLLVIEPVTKTRVQRLGKPASGGFLATGYKVPLPGNYSPDSLFSLYNDKSLPEENYRTYILGNVYGSLYRLRPKAKEEE